MNPGPDQEFLDWSVLQNAVVFDVCNRTDANRQRPLNCSLLHLRAYLVPLWRQPPSLPGKLSSRPQILQPVGPSLIGRKKRSVKCSRLLNVCTTTAAAGVKPSRSTSSSHKCQSQLARGDTFVLTLSSTCPHGHFFFHPHSQHAEPAVPVDVR